MSSDNAIVILKYIGSDEKLSFRANYVQAPQNLRYSAYYVYEAFKNVPEWPNFSLADAYATKLSKQYDEDLEYGVIICNLPNMTWEDVMEEAEYESYKYSDEQP